MANARQFTKIPRLLRGMTTFCPVLHGPLRSVLPTAGGGTAGDATGVRVDPALSAAIAARLAAGEHQAMVGLGSADARKALSTYCFGGSSLCVGVFV